MSDTTQQHGAAGHGGHGGADPHEAEHLAHYWKIYVTLLVLFLVSWAGPAVGEAIGSKALVLVTAFGIALVKAYLVCAHFMHLNVEKKYITYLLTTSLVFMFLFYAGAGPDVMEHHGRNWENVAAQQETERALKQQAAAHGHAHEDGAEHGKEAGHAH
jgi:caa(3)-type oxidase subunit IV